MLALCLAMIDDEDDQKFFEEMFYKYRDVVFSTAYLVLKDKGLAEDIVQETFMKVAAIVPKYRCYSEKHRLSSLVVVSRNKALDVIRKQKSVDALCERMALKTIVFNPGTAYAAENQMLKGIEMENINKQLSLLSEQDRNIMILYYVDGICSKDIATLTGLSGSAVRKRIERLTKKIASACVGE